MLRGSFLFPHSAGEAKRGTHRKAEGKEGMNRGPHYDGRLSWDILENEGNAWFAKMEGIAFRSETFGLQRVV